MRCNHDDVVRQGSDLRVDRLIVTHSDKRVTKCQCAHSELLIPTECAIKELAFDTSFKIVHNATCLGLTFPNPRLYTSIRCVCIVTNVSLHVRVTVKGST